LNKLQDPDHPQEEDLARWESEFNQLMNSQREESEDDFGALMRQAWENGMGDYREEEAIKLDIEGLPILGEYVFGRYLNLSLNTSISNVPIVRSK
jgi:peroxin-5